jgi:hypothetical protein
MKIGKFGRRVHASTLATHFPVNLIRDADVNDRHRAERLRARCAYGYVGSMVTKGTAPGSWGEKLKKRTNMYEPFASRERIQKRVSLRLSQAMTGIYTATDLTLLPGVLEARENFTHFYPSAHEGLVYRASQFKPLFT